MNAATLPVRFVPPEAPHAAALSRLFGRAPVRFDAAGVAVTVRFAPGGPDQEGERTRFRWSLGDAAGTLDIPASAASRLVASVEPAPLGPLDAAVRCLLIELALSPQIEALEAFTGRSFRLDPAPDASGPLVEARLQGTFGDAPLGARLGLPAAALDLLGGLADRLPRERFATVDAPVVLAVRAGTARLGAALLATAVPGDALLLREAPAGDRVVLVAGERYAAPARLDGARVTLEAPLRRAAGIGLEAWTMPDTTLAAGEDAGGVGPADAAMDDVQVTLVFELGRRAATLAELRGLAAGHVIELGRDLSGPVDILANGRRIGRGELVRVGGALAVHILGLAGHG